MSPIYWVGSPKYTAGHPAPLIALVHHRMVGTLRSTDAAFTSTDGREASTHFGVGFGCGRAGHPASAHVHQYVRLGDQAWGNGNWDRSGAWDDRYPTTLVNSRTVSIEHHDNGGRTAGSGKGVVPEAVITASIALDALLLRGDLAELKGAGIRFRGGTETAITRELRAIPIDRHHLVDHHYIAGRLKPSCWRPWADDSVGFPQARYLAALAPAPPAPEETAAAPRRLQRDGATIDPRVRGESYKVDVYEDAIGRAFEHVAVSSTLKASTVSIARRPDPDGGDGLARARIKREREQAALRFAKDRDLGKLEATMARLDAEAEASVVRPSRIPTAAEARAYLESLPELWAKTSDAGRHAIAEAVFERIDVLGATDFTFTLTAHARARGWDAAFGAGVVRAKEGRSGRGERI